MGVPASRDGAKEDVSGCSGCPNTMPQTRGLSNRCLFLPVPGAGSLRSGLPDQLNSGEFSLPDLQMAIILCPHMAQRGLWDFFLFVQRH